MLLRKLRLEKGLSQEQLAEMSGLSTRTVQRIERGAQATPESLKCLAAVLDVDFTDLRKEITMNSALTDNERETLEFVRDIKGFYQHLATFVFFTLVLLGINLWLTPGFFWAGFAALGWGIGVISHGLAVFEVLPFFGPEWEKRQVAKRLKHKNQS